MLESPDVGIPTGFSSTPMSDRIFRLLPRNLHCGLAGWMPLSSPGTIQFHQEEQAQTRIWQNPPAAIALRGQGSHALSNSGWSIHLSGSPECAERLAQALDQWETSAANTSLSELPPELSRELSYLLLPIAAGIIVHPATGRFALLRDACGFRCLYYATAGRDLVFSTCLRALRMTIGANAVNTDKVNEMLLFGGRAGGRTIWQEINVVMPGTLVLWQPSQRKHIERFFQPGIVFEPDERKRLTEQPLDRTLNEVGQAMAESLEPLTSTQRIAVPGGGGVDSSLIGAYLARNKHQVTFWSINQPDAPQRESEWIEPLARGLSIPFELVNVTRETFLTTLIEMLAASAQPVMGPNAIGGTLVQQQALARGERVFVSGELCDTLFGGLSAFHYLSPRFRILNSLASLPRRIRFWLRRSVTDSLTLAHDVSRVGTYDELARIGDGCLDRAAVHMEAASLRYPGQTPVQRMADLLTFSELTIVPQTLHFDFHERDERLGGAMIYPFAHPRLLRLGIHLPHFLKRRKGHNKWLWRVFASDYIGKEAAFRRKFAFPTLTAVWLDRAAELLGGGCLQDLFCVPLGSLYAHTEVNDSARWTLINLELWGRLHLWNESPESILRSLL